MENTVPIPLVPRWNRRRWLMIGLIGLVVAGLATGLGAAAVLEAGGEGPEPAVAESAGPRELPEGSVMLEPVVAVAPPEQLAGGTPLDGESTSSGGGGASQPTNPCDGQPTGATNHLVSRPDPVKLNPGASKGKFVISNCGATAVPWGVSSKPNVSLSPVAGLLAGHSTATVSFTINVAGLPNAPFAYVVKVSQPGYVANVDVTGTKLAQSITTVPKPSPTIGTLTSGAGCGAACITKAWLTPMPAGTTMALEVKTDTAARITATVDTDAPAHDPKGQAYFPHPDVSASTGTQYRTQWTTTLQPLTAATRYHIVVRAVDSAGRTSVQSGVFRTRSAELSAAEVGGCSANCVHSAVLSPAGGSTVDLRVTTAVAATMAVWARTEAPGKDGAGQPAYPGRAPTASTGATGQTGWTAHLKLEYGTSYHILLRVTDGQGRSEYHTGSFEAPPRPPAAGAHHVRLTLHTIVVDDDGDHDPLNWRGELRFLAEVNGVRQDAFDVGEQKVTAPATLDIGPGRDGPSIELTDAPDVLTLAVQGWDRDHTTTGFCSLGTGFQHPDRGGKRIEGCFDLQWSTARGSIDLSRPRTGGALPPCYGYGFTADMCTAIYTDGGAPAFGVYFGITVLD